jgi:hypothetical protein
MLFEVELTKTISLYVVAKDAVEAEKVAHNHAEDEADNTYDKAWRTEEVAELTALDEVPKSERTTIPWGNFDYYEETTVGAILSEMEAAVLEAKLQAEAEAKQGKLFGENK